LALLFALLLPLHIICTNICYNLLSFVIINCDNAHLPEIAARKTRLDIQTQLEVSNKDVEDAQKFLAEAEKRWEVIAIDDDDDMSSIAIEGSNKKRKANAVSPQGNNSNNNNNIGDAQGLQQTPRNPRWSNRLLHEAMGVPVPSNYGQTLSNSSSRGVVSKIVVEGCQANYANGTYIRGCDIDGCVSFFKGGSGGDVVIYRHNMFWHIALALSVSNGKLPHENGLVYYKTNSTASSSDSSGLLPPTKVDDWVSVSGGISLPTLVFHYSNDASQGQPTIQSTTTSSAGRTSVDLTNANTNNDSDIIVQGFGTEEVNGTYKKDTTKRSPFFVKTDVHWDGKVGNFRIWCNNSKFWYVSGSMEFGGKVLYKNNSSTNSASVPPQTGWIPVMGLHRPLCPSPTMNQRGYL